MQTIKIPRVKTLLNERPSDMPYEEYRWRLREQAKFLHGYWKEDEKGERVHVMGRLEGILVASAMYRNGGDPRVMVE